MSKVRGEKVTEPLTKDVAISWLNLARKTDVLLGMSQKITKRKMDGIRNNADGLKIGRKPNAADEREAEVKAKQAVEKEAAATGKPAVAKQKMINKPGVKQMNGKTVQVREGVGK